ncbi:MAG: hypothetical protein U1F76_28765 [Candidatus Competibacteraceae bacterium]
MALEPQRAADTVAVDNDIFDDRPEPVLAVGHGGRSCLPDSGHIFPDGQDRLALLSGDLGRVRLPPGLVLLLDRLDGAELLFPAVLKAPSDKPVFRLDAVVLALCPLGFKAAPLQAKLPSIS